MEQVWLIGTRQLAGLLAGSKRFMKRISIYQEKGTYLSGEGDLSIRRRESIYEEKGVHKKRWKNWRTRNTL